MESQTALSLKETNVSSNEIKAAANYQESLIGKEDLKLLKELHNAILPLDETIAKLNRRDTDSKTKS